ncbi:hypothetical protein AX17_004028 [Amanita inopinata Kibby_2008]|nr:hypothetical protein AX17_004028 [Amanita inopinata Kibby_2008]
MGRGVLLTANLPQLQNLIKRDPISYKDEFLQQWNHYNSIRQLFKINPDDQAGHFRGLVSFISQVATCYPTETAAFPSQLSSLLTETYAILPPDTRRSLIQNLVTLRKKDVISSINLLKCLFPLLPRTPSAQLRRFIQTTITSDIRSANARRKNSRLNRAVQAMFFGMVERGMEEYTAGDKGKLQLDRRSDDINEALWAIIVAKDLWKRGTWTDAKTVAIIALGCMHPITKVQIASIHFFIGDDTSDDTEDEHKDVDVRALQHQREVNKKTRGRERKLQKQLKKAREKRQTLIIKANFPAIELLHDPQSFAEKLLDLLERFDKRLSLDHKILIMQLLSRVMDVHKICVLNFYTYIIKYLSHHQLRVPTILAALTQSVHNMTPPNSIEPILKKLAQEFVHPGVANEVIAAGLNSIKEISRRQPWAMDGGLLGDLVEYRKSRDKGVMAAARGLLRLYREINPALLKRRERGKEASRGATKNPLQFGHVTEAAIDIEGLVLLEDHLKKLDEQGADRDDDILWNDWATDSDFTADSDSEGWINVEDGDDDVTISDSEGEADHTNQQEPVTADTRVSTLATTKILTPADFALLNDLRNQAAIKSVNIGVSGTKRKLSSFDAIQAQSIPCNHQVTEDDILGPRKKAKADYAERVASIHMGREGREKFGSQRGKQKKNVPSSSTNREKAKNKPIMMILSSHAMRSKKKTSLREKQRKLRTHIEKTKKAKH